MGKRIERLNVIWMMIELIEGAGLGGEGAERRGNLNFQNAPTLLFSVKNIQMHSAYVTGANGRYII